MRLLDDSLPAFEKGQGVLHEWASPLPPIANGHVGGSPEIPFRESHIRDHSVFCELFGLAQGFVANGIATLLGYGGLSNLGRLLAHANIHRGKRPCGQQHGTTTP